MNNFIQRITTAITAWWDAFCPLMDEHEGAVR
jgi:hypothetical protein